MNAPGLHEQADQVNPASVEELNARRTMLQQSLQDARSRIEAQRSAVETALATRQDLERQLDERRQALEAQKAARTTLEGQAARKERETERLKQELVGREQELRVSCSNVRCLNIKDRFQTII